MATINTPFPAARRQTTWSTFVGLALALFGFPVWQWMVLPVIEPFVAPIPFVLFGQGGLWMLALSVLAISVYWERTPLVSLGVRPLSWRMALVAIGLGIVLGIAVPLLAALANHMFPPSPGGTIQSNSAKAPAWVWMVIVLTASVVEEVLFRAYPFERLARVTHSRWLAASLSLGAFVAIHVSWHMAHVVGVVLPGGALFMALYVWRRNLLFNILVHVVVDLPLVLMAAGILPPL